MFLLYWRKIQDLNLCGYFYPICLANSDNKPLCQSSKKGGSCWPRRFSCLAPRATGLCPTCLSSTRLYYGARSRTRTYMIHRVKVSLDLSDHPCFMVISNVIISSRRLFISITQSLATVCLCLGMTVRA